MSERDPLWPLEHARDVYSQMGEDGIAEALLAQFPNRNNWVVEFGAWDGVHLSNSRYLVAHRDFSAVLIEGSDRRFTDLEALYRNRADVHTIHAYVRTCDPNTLDDILSRTPTPKDFDYLSIDIDGNDYHVWASLLAYRPKLVCIEFNPTVASDIEFIQPDDFSIKHGASIKAMVNLGRQKGYELAAMTTGNAFFVSEEMFPYVEIADNSINVLRADTSYVTHVFSGYDGTMFIVGSTELPFHQIPMRLANHQELPRLLRKFPLDYGPGRKVTFWAYYAARHPANLSRKALRRFRRHRLWPTQIAKRYRTRLD
ncbi:MAG: FkbM family methyltransferase [Actinomycetota bacterium]|nr:FkbM family methyltransferase [Actinomycetota bacterium]